MITNVAGTGAPGFNGDNIPATSAQIKLARGVAVDAKGTIYIADSSNNRIRKVSGGVITTVAGTGTAAFGGDNGPATGAKLNYPLGIATDASGNLFIADYGNGRVREISNGVIATVAGNGVTGYAVPGGPATGSPLFNPWAVTLDSHGVLYVANLGYISKVAGGVTTLVAGSGAPVLTDMPAGSVQLTSPRGVAADAAGNVYIADTGNSVIRRVFNGRVSTFAGTGIIGYSGDNGPAVNASLNLPAGVAVDSTGNVYISDTGNNVVRRISKGVITTVAGNGTQGFSGDGGSATGAQLNSPAGLAVDSDGNIFIADSRNNRIREVSHGLISTVAGNGSIQFFTIGDGGPATSAVLLNPAAVALSPAGDLYIADGQNLVRVVSKGIIDLAVGNYRDEEVDPSGTRLSELSGVAFDSAGNLYISDNSCLRVLSPAKTVRTLAGCVRQGLTGDNGPSVGAALYLPQAVAADSAGNVYVADVSNRVRVLTPGTPPKIAGGPGYVSAIQPGSWFSIYGSNLAPDVFLWNGDFPASLGGTTVNVNGKPASLWFVSPTQINAQAPDDSLTGLVSLTVTTSSGTATSAVMLEALSPSFSLLGDGRHVAGEIVTPVGTGAYGSYDLVGPLNTFSYSTRPVHAGETLVLFGVGFGDTKPHIAAGSAFTGAAPTVGPVSISIGGVNADVSFAGLTEAGLYQFNLTVPNVAGGEQPVVATVNGVQTPPGAIVSVQ